MTYNGRRIIYTGRNPDYEHKIRQLESQNQRLCTQFDRVHSRHNEDKNILSSSVKKCDKDIVNTYNTYRGCNDEIAKKDKFAEYLYNTKLSLEKDDTPEFFRNLNTLLTNMHLINECNVNAMLNVIFRTIDLDQRTIQFYMKVYVDISKEVKEDAKERTAVWLLSKLEDTIINYDLAQLYRNNRNAFMDIIILALTSKGGVDIGIRFLLRLVNVLKSSYELPNVFQIIQNKYKDMTIEEHLDFAIFYVWFFTKSITESRLCTNVSKIQINPLPINNMFSNIDIISLFLYLNEDTFNYCTKFPKVKSFYDAIERQENISINPYTFFNERDYIINSNIIDLQLPESEIYNYTNVIIQYTSKSKYNVLKAIHSIKNNKSSKNKLVLLKYVNEINNDIIEQLSLIQTKQFEASLYGIILYDEYNEKHLIYYNKYEKMWCYKGKDKWMSPKIQYMYLVYFNKFSDQLGLCFENQINNYELEYPLVDKSKPRTENDVYWNAFIDIISVEPNLLKSKKYFLTKAFKLNNKTIYDEAQVYINPNKQISTINSFDLNSICLIEYLNNDHNILHSRFIELTSTNSPHFDVIEEVTEWFIQQFNPNVMDVINYEVAFYIALIIIIKGYPKYIKPDLFHMLNIIGVYEYCLDNVVKMKELMKFDIANLDLKVLYSKINNTNYNPFNQTYLNLIEIIIIMQNIMEMLIMNENELNILNELNNLSNNIFTDWNLVSFIPDFCEKFLKRTFKKSTTTYMCLEVIIMKYINLDILQNKEGNKILQMLFSLIFTTKKEFISLFYQMDGNAINIIFDILFKNPRIINIHDLFMILNEFLITENFPSYTRMFYQNTKQTFKREYDKLNPNNYLLKYAMTLYIILNKIENSKIKIDYSSFIPFNISDCNDISDIYVRFLLLSSSIRNLIFTNPQLFTPDIVNVFNTFSESLKRNEKPQFNIKSNANSLLTQIKEIHYGESPQGKNELIYNLKYSLFNIKQPTIQNVFPYMIVFECDKKKFDDCKQLLTKTVIEFDNEKKFALRGVVIITKSNTKEVFIYNKYNEKWLNVVSNIWIEGIDGKVVKDVKDVFVVYLRTSKGVKEKSVTFDTLNEILPEDNKKKKKSQKIEELISFDNTTVDYKESIKWVENINPKVFEKNKQFFYKFFNIQEKRSCMIF